jgi:dihydrofolate reductase
VRKIVELDISISRDGFLNEPYHSYGRLPGKGSDRRQHWIWRDSSMIENENLTQGDSAPATGALLVRRRTYDLVDGWGRTDPFEGVSVLVLTQAGPQAPPQDKTPFTFVTEGIASAVAQAMAAIGDENVYVIDGVNVAQKTISARQLDEIRLHLVPLLLGEGIRLFEQSSEEPIELEIIRVMQDPGVAYIWFRMLG